MHQNPFPVSNDERWFYICTFKIQMALIFPLTKNGDREKKHIIFFQIEIFKWTRLRRSPLRSSLEKGGGGLVQNKEGKRRFMFHTPM